MVSAVSLRVLTTTRLSWSLASGFFHASSTPSEAKDDRILAAFRRRSSDLLRSSLRDAIDQRAPSESLMSYQKMPSGSTVRTLHNEEAKTHSTGFPGSARDPDDVPQFDDTVWVDDNDFNVNFNGKRPTPATASNLPANVANPNHQVEVLDNSPSSLNRRPVRPRHPTTKDSVEPVHSRSTPNIATNHQVTGISTVTPANPNPSPNAHGGTSSAAVAATAAAIAAAKDRERKRELRGPTMRVTRPANQQGGETSFQSLPVAGDGHARNETKARAENKANFYNNSDEEAHDFDPERAAAEEAIAETNSTLAAQSEPVRHANLAS